MNAAKWIFLTISVIFLSLAGLGLILPKSSAPTHQKPLDPALTEQLPPLIRQMGLRCHVLSDMTLYAKTERGDVFKAICDEQTNYYRYRVLYTPTGSMTIRPWSE